MKPNAFILLALIFIPIWGCTSKGAYEAIQQNQCLEKTGSIYCDEEESYEEYQRKREELLKDKTTYRY